MKIIISIFILALTAACASIDSNRIAPGYIEAFSSISKLLFENDKGIDPELIKNIPYASMVVKIGKGPSALLILESINNDNFTWVSADGVYLVINNGKIVATSGLPNNLKEKITTSGDWNNKVKNNLEYISYNSYSLPTLNNLKVKSTYTYKGKDVVKTVFGDKTFRLVEEKIDSHEIGWHRTNRYWLDETNYVWKSSQYISPRLPEIHFEIAKKPR